VQIRAEVEREKDDSKEISRVEQEEKLIVKEVQNKDEEKKEVEVKESDEDEESSGRRRWCRSARVVTGADRNKLHEETKKNSTLEVWKKLADRKDNDSQSEDGMLLIFSLFSLFYPGLDVLH